jgi:hypothetical protein
MKTPKKKPAYSAKPGESETVLIGDYTERKTINIEALRNSLQPWERVMVGHISEAIKETKFAINGKANF